ncbi:MAG: exosortase/archaeosortase family protein [Candidatus Acidiferrum sp.]
MVSTTTNLAGVSAPAPSRDWQGWAQFFLMLIAIWLLYHRVAAGLVRQWWSDPDYNYGFFVPALSAVAVWKESARLKKITPQPSWTGLLVIVGALALLVLGVLGAENFVARASLLFLLAGLAIQFRGWKFFRALLFPWAALFLMIPLPAIIFNQIAVPLQFVASRLGASLLSLSGITVLRQGNVISLPTMTLDVVEACSGLRSLLSIITVSVFYGYIFEKGIVRRLLLVACSIPIAIFANALRITFTGLIGYFLNTNWAEGFYHTSSSVLVFLYCFLALVGLRRLFDWCSDAIRQRKADA